IGAGAGVQFRGESRTNHGGSRARVSVRLARPPGDLEPEAMPAAPDCRRNRQRPPGPRARLLQRRTQHRAVALRHRRAAPQPRQRDDPRSAVAYLVVASVSSGCQPAAYLPARVISSACVPDSMISPSWTTWIRVACIATENRWEMITV